MWKERKEAQWSDEMQNVLDASPKVRTTIQMLLCDCKTDEIATALMRIKGRAGYHQKIVMMRRELVRRNPELANMRTTDIPIEYYYAWEIVCRPFRELSKKKREKENLEKIKRDNERLKAGLEGRTF